MERILLPKSYWRGENSQIITQAQTPISFRLQDAQIIRISEPIKSEWAKKLNLSLTELLSDGPYKEKYRKQMITWSETVRNEDPGIFCREAMKAANSSIIIVSDIRRRSDIRWFKENYGDRIRTIRIFADDSVRVQRGWVFTYGVDDNASELDLDGFTPWDYSIENSDDAQVEQRLEELVDFVHKSL